MRELFSLISILFICQLVFSHQFWVNTTNINGTGSLTAALNLCNSTSGNDTIRFDIPTTDAGYNASQNCWTISLASLLPMVYEGSVFIDGSSQEEQQGIVNPKACELYLRGNNLNLAYGLCFLTSGNHIKDIGFQNMAVGIVFYGLVSFNNKVELCRGGVSCNSLEAQPNGVFVVASGGSHHNEISRCQISGNTEAGIVLQNTKYNQITGNMIGTDPDGKTSIPNGQGIVLDSASYNTIGGQDPLSRNFISGNTDGAGVVIQSKESSSNEIIGNFIGCDSSGTIRLPNLAGISISKSNGNSIKWNLISGNTDCGIVLSGKYSNNNTISGNLIGVDITGSQLLYNDKGIVLKSLANKNIIGGKTVESRNIISGNLEIGIYIEASDSTTIQGNFIGTDISGMQIIKSGERQQGNGIEFNTVAKNNLLGGYLPNEQNLISGNKVYGVVYYGNCYNNSTINNLIGTDISSKSPLPNATGICLDCASHSNDIIGNVISGNLSYGLFFVTRGTYYNKLQGNIIGLDSNGEIAVPNDIGLVISTGAANNLIGGNEATEKNIISGNNLSGIMITNFLTNSNQIIGNYIGTDKTGSFAIPNLYGILMATYPKHNIIHGNLISGNEDAGIIIYESADSNKFTGNFIGTNSGGTAAIPNGNAGIYLDQGVQHCQIGGIDSTNIIAFNKGSGIFVKGTSTLFNKITRNSFYGNEYMAIDISPGGPTENDNGDFDAGPAELQNYPIIENAYFYTNTSQSVINGFLDTPTPQLCQIELYINHSSYLSPYQAQGMDYIGNAYIDDQGFWVASIPQSTDGGSITAIAIDVNGNTSEFSSAKDVITENSEIELMDSRLFPNPCSRYFHFTNDGLNPVKEISVYNCQGIKIYSEKLMEFKKNVQIACESWVPGLYMVQVEFSNHTKQLQTLIKE